MTLTSVSAVALWHAELTGQMSDGLWENTRPHDHWRFWCDLEVVTGDKDVAQPIAGCWPDKTSYSFGRLIEYVGDRMLKYGQMAKAGADPTNRELIDAGEWMPPTLDAFKKLRSVQRLPEEMSYEQRKIAPISDELAEKFYAVTYTEKELRADFRLIQKTMKQFSV